MAQMASLPRLAIRMAACVPALVLVVGCRADAAPLVVEAQPADTLARIRALAAAPTCTDDSQCHSLPLGASPCGGPEGYLAWSSARTAPDQIQALGKALEAERRRANAASGRMGACRVRLDPGATCRAGVCELKPGTLPAQ